MICHSIANPAIFFLDCCNGARMYGASSCKGCGAILGTAKKTTIETFQERKSADTAHFVLQVRLFTHIDLTWVFHAIIQFGEDTYLAGTDAGGTRVAPVVLKQLASFEQWGKVFRFYLVCLVREHGNHELFENRMGWWDFANRTPGLRF